MATSVLADQKSLHYLLESIGPKGRLYVEARCRGSVPVVAARMAGFSDPDAKAEELERSDMVRTAIEYAIRAQLHELRITRNDVINGFLDAVRLAESSFEVTAAWREIGKVIGAYAPQKVEISGSVALAKEKLEKLPDEELAKLAAIDAEFVVLEGEKGAGDGQNT